jgi:hypothetical protein
MKVLFLLFLLLSGCCTGYQEIDTKTEIKNGGINMTKYPPVTLLENNELKTEVK